MTGNGYSSRAQSKDVGRDGHDSKDSVGGTSSTVDKSTETRLGNMDSEARQRRKWAEGGKEEDEQDSDWWRRLQIPDQLQQVNVGNECYAYLQFIVDNYDCLPEVIFFTQVTPAYCGVVLPGRMFLFSFACICT